MRGSGPWGQIRGETEQKVFPHIILTDEKKELVVTEFQIMVEALFNHHYYTFGNNIYHQKGGGPNGLRGACAVARVTMLMWNINCKGILEKEGITTWLLARYMDDARAFLPPFKHGWRWTKDGLRLCQLWAQEDIKLKGPSHLITFFYI